MKSSLEALRDSDKLQRNALMKITKLHNLTSAEWQLLSTMAAGIYTQDKLSSETGLDTSTLSRQLKGLYDKEFIDKVSTGHDRRQLVYSVLPKGEEALKEINKQYIQLEKEIFDKWTNEEMNMLRILLNRLDKSMNRLSQ